MTDRDYMNLAIEQAKICVQVQPKNTLETTVAKVRLSTNWAMNVETYERIANEVKLSFFSKRPIFLFKSAFIIEEIKKASDEPKTMYQDPPKVLFNALFTVLPVCDECSSAV